MNLRQKPTSPDSDLGVYGGRRILKAMEEARAYADAIFAELRAEAGSTGQILDFGAGSGIFARRFAALSRSIDCIEPDAELRKGLGGFATRIYANIADVDTQSYDFIYAVNVLEHIPDLDGVCSGLRHVLRPGGRLFIFVPAFEILWTSLDEEVGHVRRFTCSSLGRALTKADLEVRRMEYFDSLGLPAALSVRLLENFGLFHYSDDTVGLYDRWIFPVSRRADRVFRTFFGKNILAIAERKSDRSRSSEGRGAW